MKEMSLIEVYNEAEDHWLYKARPFDRFHAYFDLIALSSRENKVMVRGKLFTTERGKAFISQGDLGNRWGWDRMKVRRFMDELKADGLIEQKGTAHGTLIRIVNFDLALAKAENGWRDIGG